MTKKGISPLYEAVKFFLAISQWRLQAQRAEIERQKMIMKRSTWEGSWQLFVERAVLEDDTRLEPLSLEPFGLLPRGEQCIPTQCPAKSFMPTCPNCTRDKLEYVFSER